MVPSDSEITFLLNTRGDVGLLPACLQQLREVYPSARVIIRSDGDRDPEIGLTARAFAAEVHYGEWLFPIERGGELVHEMLRLFLQSPSAWFFKIDPDTRVVRRFTRLPKQPCIFGSIQQQGGLFSIQGGCVGFTRDVSADLVQSRYFLNPAFACVPPPWAFNTALQHRPAKLGLTSVDWLVGWAAHERAIDLLDWPEILSEWQELPVHAPKQYAVTHPHKPTPPPDDACVTSVRRWGPSLLVPSGIEGVQCAPRPNKLEIPA